MDQQTALQYTRRSLGRIGWAIAAYFVASQLIGSVLMLIPGVMDSIVLTMVCNDLAIYVLGPVVLWLILRPLPKGISPSATLSPRAFARTAVYAMGMGYLFNYATTLIIFAVEALSGQSTGNVLESQLSAMPVWLAVLTVGFIAPVCEELIFRKLLLDRLRPFGDRCAIWVSALAFGLFHMNLYQIVYAVVLGLIFAGVAVKTGKLRYVIVFHAIINNFSLLVSYLYPLFEVGSTGETVFNLITAAVIITLIVLAIVYFVRYAKTYRFYPPQLPITTRQAMLTLTRCPGMWITAAIGLGMGVLVIFLV